MRLHERSFPAVGEEVEAEIGQPVMILERYYAGQSLRLLEPIKSGSALGNKIVLAPGLYALAVENDKGRYYEAVGGVTLNALGMNMPWPKGGILVPSDAPDTPRAYWENDLGMRASGSLSQPKITDAGIAEVSADGFRVTLSYTGVSKGTVSLSYREFIRDMARPAFSQELTYDLGEGDEIGFRGARLKVLKATNTSIHYQVVKPLAAPGPQ
ncbi:MAG: hypothetical protein B7Y81_04280 [Caulobacter sp. 32-67-35]|nr:MAG: hypothetical protein B7Y81_04280 [Caulobacter sp. 32-67-35]